MPALSLASKDIKKISPYSNVYTMLSLGDAGRRVQRNSVYDFGNFI